MKRLKVHAMKGYLRYVAGGGMVASLLMGQASAERQAIIMQCEVGVGFFIPPVADAPEGEHQEGFVVAASGVPIEDTPAGEAIKLIEQGRWVEAIQKIESLRDAGQGLVLDRHGVLRPLSRMKSALIAAMPEEGRRTFCRLNDPAANTKLAEALALDDLNVRALAFEQLVTDYALCAASAKAAMGLGDIRFEQGRFYEAASAYRFAAEHHANPSDDPALMARQLTALSRGGQYAAFESLAQYARFRHPDTMIQIAGRPTRFMDYIAELQADPNHQPDHPAGVPHDQGTSGFELLMPTTSEWDYARPLIEQDHLKFLRQVAVNHGLGSIIDQAIAPVVVSDQERLFALSLGRLARLNPETGTELWHQGASDVTVQNFASRMHQLTSGYHQALVLHEQSLIAVIPDPQNISNAYLHVFDAETGQEKWNLKDLLRRTNEAVVGEPLVVDDVVYFVTYQPSMELTLRSVALSNGSPMKSLVLGKASKGAALPGPAELSPRLMMGQSHLMVQTNNGAMIAVSTESMSIQWALTQKIRQSGMDVMRRHGHPVREAVSRHTGKVITRDGLILAKDTRTNRVVAMREHDAAMLWSAATDSDSTLVHIDDQHAYVLGEELVALDLRSGERVWWTPHPGSVSGQPVFTKDACLIAGNQRLCRIDLATGKLTDFREDAVEAADLHKVGGQLVSVSPFGLTALPLP